MPLNPELRQEKIRIIRRVLILSAIIIVASYVITVLGCTPPDYYFQAICEVPDQFALFIGAVIGTTTTALFFVWIEMGQKEVEAYQEQLRHEQFEVFANLFYPRFINAYKLGQCTWMLANEPSEKNEYWPELVRLCNTLGIIDAARIVSDMLKPPQKPEIVLYMRGTIALALDEVQGFAAADIFLAGMYSTMFSVLSSKNQLPRDDFVKVFVQSLRAIGIDPKVRDYCEKSFQLWMQEKITNVNAFIFLNLVDLYIRHRGSVRGNVEQLFELLTSDTLPSNPEFEPEARKILEQDFQINVDGLMNALSSKKSSKS